MNLLSLTLHNFGVYAGRHELSLGCKPKRPITLVGALNGSGKTTILEGIQLCLFGRNAKFLESSNEGYARYLAESINRNHLHESAAVELSFSVKRDGKERVYEVRRTWTLKARGPVETVQVLVDQEHDPDLSDRWAEVVERFLPNQLSDLFFFDGERIEALADPKRCSEMIKVGLNNLLGLDLITDLQKSLAVLDKRMKSEGLSDSKRKALDFQHSRLSQLQIELQQLNERRSQFLQQISGLNERKFELRRVLEASGADLLERRDELMSTRAALTLKRENLEDALRECAESTLPLVLLTTQIEDLSRLASHSLTPNRRAELVEVLQRFSGQLLAELQGVGLLPNAPGAAEIAKGVAAAQLETRSSTNVDIETAEIKRVQDDMLEQRRRSIERTRELEAIKREFDRVEELLDAMPAPEKIQPLLDQLRLIEEEIAQHTRELSELDFLAEKNYRDTASTESAIETILSEEREIRAKSVRHENMKLQLERAKKHLEVFLGRMREKNVESLQENVLACLRELFRKRKLIRTIWIDRKTFEVFLVVEGEGRLPAHRLSAGERQMLAVAVLWGLARTSKRSLPTVIDTPLGRLDSLHRTAFVERYFPNASKQVVLLSTDEEIVGPYHRMLETRISNEYLIQYDEESQSSSIVEGYFSKIKEAA